MIETRTRQSTDSRKIDNFWREHRWKWKLGISQKKIMNFKIEIVEMKGNESGNSSRNVFERAKFEIVYVRMARAAL